MWVSRRPRGKRGPLPRASPRSQHAQSSPSVAMMSVMRAAGAARAAASCSAKAPARRVQARAGEANWIPGSEKPAYLEGLAGNYGADPFKLGEDPANLAWYVQRARVRAPPHPRRRPPKSVARAARLAGAALAARGRAGSAPRHCDGVGKRPHRGLGAPRNRGASRVRRRRARSRRRDARRGGRNLGRAKPLRAPSRSPCARPAPGGRASAWSACGGVDDGGCTQHQAPAGALP